VSNRIQRAFDDIKADDSLRESTMAFVSRELAHREKKKPAPRFRMAFAALAAAFVIMIGGGYSAYALPSSYVSIDVNPSIELTLNRFDRVIAATAYNADGAQILDGQNLRNMLYTDAIDTLVNCTAFQAYMTEENDLSFTVVSKNEAKLMNGILNCAAVTRYGAYYAAADAETLQAAHQYGMSFGKYQAYLDLTQYDSSITPEQCSNMTMREIHTLTAQYGGAGGGSGTGSQDGTGGGFGYQCGTEDGAGNVCGTGTGAGTGADAGTGTGTDNGNGAGAGSGTGSGGSSGYHGGN
jgi:hypothetical protein